MRPFRGWLTVVLILGFPALAASCTHRAPDTAMPDRNVITAEQIEAAHERTAYDLVVKFKSNFLHSRGKNSLVLKVPSEPTVYLDDVEYGPVNSLRSIPASNVAEIRFFEGWEAMTKYGSDHVSGVIQVVTRMQ